MHKATTLDDIMLGGLKENELGLIFAYPSSERKSWKTFIEQARILHERQQDAIISITVEDLF